jgi:REP element-mobilizing transposase RayT
VSRSYRVFSEKHYAYFVTCTLVEWLPAFATNAYRQIVLDSLAYIREHKRTQLNAFVIMATHLHAVLFPEEGVNLSDVLRDFKRFTSRAISEEAAQTGDHPLLDAFALARRHGRAQDTSQYQVWQEGSHPEAIYTPGFARQKIEYIHNNPVRAGLVNLPEEWLYSSARAYLNGETTYPEVDILEFG